MFKRKTCDDVKRCLLTVQTRYGIELCGLINSRYHVRTSQRIFRTMIHFPILVCVFWAARAAHWALLSHTVLFSRSQLISALLYCQVQCEFMFMSKINKKAKTEHYANPSWIVQPQC